MSRQKNSADVAVAQHIPAAAQHRVVIAVATIVRLRLSRHQPKTGAADPPGQPPAGGDRNRIAGVGEADPPAEEQQDLFLGRCKARIAKPRLARNVAEIEHAGVLEKELAFLRKEQAELREVHLLLVGFRLREVGARGDVERQRGGHAVLQIHAGVAAIVELFSADPASRVGRHPRLQSEVSARIGVWQARHRPAETGSVKVVDARNRRPEIDFVLATNPAAEVDTPHAINAWFESQGLERNPNFGGPSGSIHPGYHKPHRVPARIHVAPFIRDLGVGFGTNRIHHEHETITAVGERIEDHFEAVLLAG